MADLRKRIKVLLITKREEDKGNENLINSEEERIISDKESACKLKKKEEEEAISEKKEEAKEKEADYIAIEDEEKAKEAAAYTLKGKEKLINSEEEQRISEREAAYRIKGKAKMIDSEEKLPAYLIQEATEEVKIRNLIQELAVKLNLEVDIIECNTTDDLLEIEDLWEINFVFVEEIFFQTIFVFITEVAEFVSIPIIFFSSNPKWQLLHKTSKYKKGSSAGIHLEDIPNDKSFIGRLMEKGCVWIPDFKESSHSDSCGNQDVEAAGHNGEVGEELQVQAPKELLVQAPEELQVQAPEDPGPQLPQSMKLKKRWQRDWDQSSD